MALRRGGHIKNIYTIFLVIHIFHLDTLYRLKCLTNMVNSTYGKNIFVMESDGKVMKLSYDISVGTLCTYIHCWRCETES